MKATGHGACTPFLRLAEEEKVKV